MRPGRSGSDSEGIGKGLKQMDAEERLPALRPADWTPYAVARSSRRDVTECVKEATAMATASPSVAQSCIAHRPQAGKQVEGASARFAEILKSAWGNLRVDCRLKEELETEIVVEAVALDLEKNLAERVERRASIWSRKTGERFAPALISGMIQSTSGFARRDAVLKLIPRALWEPILEECRRIAGKAPGGRPAAPPRSAAPSDGPSGPPAPPDLATRRLKALAWFGGRGVPEAAILGKLGRRAAEDLTAEDVDKLREWARMVLDEACTLEGLFGVR